MNRPPRIFAGACLLLTCACARAEDAAIVYYDIFGSSDRELLREMTAKGPVGESGEKGFGHARWDVTWNFRYAPATGGCVITEIDAVVKGKITLPRWKGEDRGSSALVANWHRFMQALRTHEDGHYAFGISAAEEIRTLGRSFRIFESCSAIGDLFNGKAQAIIARYVRADKQYDTDTRHGLTQGARFP